MEEKKGQYLSIWEQEKGKVITLKVIIGGKTFPVINPILKIEKKLGVHTKAKLKGEITQEEYNTILTKVNANTEIVFYYGDGEKDFILFYGVVSYVDAKTEGLGENNLYQLIMEALSFSCLLDLEKQSRSFQDTSMSYLALIEEVVKDSNAAFLVSTEAKNGSIGGFTLQYEETNWEFLKRMASRLHLPLVASHISKGKKFTFGVIWKENAYLWEEKEIKEIFDLRLFQARRKKEEEETANVMYYEINTKGPDMQSLEIGESVFIEGRKFYIYEAAAMIKDHILSHHYRLSTKEGFARKTHYAKQIVGLSLQGEVVEVKKNLLRIHLDIDVKGSKDVYWFSYATFYATFFCMPEIKDRVNVYFPNAKEENVFALNSVNQAISSQNEKMSSNLEGKEGGNLEGGKEKDTIGASKKAEESEDLANLLTKLANPTAGKLSELQIKPREGTEPKAENRTPSVPTQAGSGGGNSSLAQGAAESSSSNQGVDFEALTQNEKVKVLATKEGNMVILDDEKGRVSIISKDGSSIHLTDGQGISILTNNAITFSSQSDVDVIAKNSIFLTAEEEISLQCKESSIVITEEKINITGTDIKLNE